MKKLLCTVSIAAFIPFSAFAQVGGAQLTGNVNPFCLVNDIFDAIDFDELVTGDTVADDFAVACNDADGATLTLTSTEGGLESDDNEDFEVEYTATVSGTGIAPWDGLQLDTGVSFGVNDIFVSASSGEDAFDDLVGGVSGTVTFIVGEVQGFAGGYSDTFYLTISAD